MRVEVYGNKIAIDTQILYLSNNQITEIQGLDALVNLHI